MGYGAQHTHILDDRDVDEYYKNPKFERFVHLKQTTVKIIVYSTVETILHVNMANLWFDYSWTEHSIRVKEGMNVICVCCLRDSEEWPEQYQRVTVEVRGLRQVCLHPTPDLDYRWQALIVTERCPLSLEETALIATGFHNIRRESDVAEWESTDWHIKRAHDYYAGPLSSFKLTLAQKVLLMYNNTGIRRHSCVEIMAADMGHVTQALFSQVPFYQAFNWEFIFDHKDKYLWFENQWIHMVDSHYWKSVRSSHLIYDFQDWEFRPGWYGDAWTLGRTVI